MRQHGLGLVQASRAGRIREIFACGTAAVIQPVNELVRAGREPISVHFDVRDATTITARLTRALTDIQYGRVEHEWSVAFD